MKCEKCGAEIKDGYVYCSVCGNAVQLVPDYNLLDEDLLGDIIQKEARGGSKDAAPKPDGKKRTRRRKKLIGGAVIAVLLAAALTSFFLYREIEHRHAQSYDYQFEKAESNFEAGDYNSAAVYYRRALSLRAADPMASKRLAEIYVEQEEEEEAALLLEALVEAGKEDTESLQLLIEIYDRNGDYSKIVELCDKVDGSNMPLLFGNYLVQPPKFEREPGTYGEELLVSMEAEPGCDILYTTDGEDPTLQGKLYENGILLEEEGTTVFFAVARNRKGIYSKTARASYTVRFEIPDMPSVSPSGGTYYEAQKITVSAPEGCSIYYTWDGSNPTEQSAKYGGPLDMPPGNQVLSVVAVNAAGAKSGVYRVNYVYMP